MNRCCGESVLMTNRHTLVCRLCGLEKKCAFSQTCIHYNQNTYSTHAPLVPVYSRKKRFSRLLASVLSPSPQPGDDKMLAYLFEHKPISDTPALLKLMKISSVKDKRYCSLHLFCKLFVPSYTAPIPPDNLEHLRTTMLKCFEEVEFAHRRHFRGEHMFFNYGWILQMYLRIFGMAQYLKFVKPLKCKHRRDVYEKMYLAIMRLDTLPQALDDVLRTHRPFFERDDGLSTHLLQ